jgi:molecular chaperone DnaK (HSP70)
MIKEAISYQEHDEKIRVYREARMQLQKHCIKIKNMLENLNLLPHITSDDKQTIEAIAVDGEEWVKKNANADFGTTQ